MTATRQDIQGWLDRGKEEGRTHLIVVTDTYDHDNYPVYVSPHHDVYEIEKEYNGKNMQHVEEIYWLAGDLDEQIKRRPRCKEYGPPKGEADARR